MPTRLHMPRRCLALFIVTLTLVAGIAYAAEPFSSARIAVYFSPNGGATDAVVCELNAAAAIELYRAMDMTFWLPKTEAALAQVER